MHYLGIDIGTSNIKTLLIDSGGCVVAKGSSSVGRYESDGLAVEQDIDEIFFAVCTAVKQITAKINDDRIISVGISSQGGAIVPLDKNSLPVCRVISWLDLRGEKYDKRLTEKLGREYFAAHTGHPKSIMFPGQFLRLKTESPEIFSRIKRWGFVGDVIVGMLTGRRVHDYTSLSIAGLLNPQMKKADPDLLHELGLAENQLPELAESYSIAGKIISEAAEQAGLCEGTKVSPAVHDQYAASIAADVIRDGDVMIATGTAWVILAACDKCIPPVVEGAFACPHLVKNLYGQMIPLGTGGSEIQRAMQKLGYENFSLKQVDDLLRDLQSPVYEAVKKLAELTQKQFELLQDAGLSAKRIVLTGPAAESKITPNIIQKITGLEVKCFHEPAASAYGAALIAKKIHEL